MYACSAGCGVTSLKVNEWLLNGPVVLVLNM
jgi:hypothetical protein